MLNIQIENFGDENLVRATFNNKRLLLAVHIHQFAELVYVMEGELTVKHNKLEEVARAGDLVVIMPYQEHGFYTEKNKKVKYWMVLFSDALMADIVYRESTYFDYKELVLKPSDTLRELIDLKMFDTGAQVIKADFERTLDLKSLMYTTFSEYFQKKPSNSQKNSASHNQALASDPIIKTINYLRINFRRDVGINDCAKEIGYSASHISHSLKRQFNISFTELLHTIRINYSKHLFIHKRMSIYMVAIECGFNRESTFKTVFKKLTNETPLQYVKSIRNKNGKRH